MERVQGGRGSRPVLTSMADPHLVAASDASLVTLSTVTTGRVVVVLFRHCV